MSASMETRIVPQSPLVKMGAWSLARSLGFSARRERVGDISVWDGEARFRLPFGLRNFFRVSLYVTVRRAPADKSDLGASAKI